MFMANQNPTLSDVRKTEAYYFACGGLADIYKGQWTPQSGETLPVAIKLVRRCTWNDKTAADRARRRFLREAHLWAQLHHPNIVPFYGLIFEKNFPGLVMPYYKNGDLTQFLRKHPHVNKLEMICEVAAGLEYLHNLRPNSVVHGDIKASNIMITDDHRACLTDFGVAKMLSVSGYTTTSLGGTCRWMAPEILEDYDPSPTLASDVWAFGMTILQIYTGKVPFENLRNDATVIVSLYQGKLPPQPPEINDTIWALLKQCWKGEASERPPISTVSIVLSIIASQNLSAEHINDLVDYLEQGRDSSNDEETLHMTPVATSMTDTLVQISTPDQDKPKKTTLGSQLRRLSFDKYIPSHDGRPLSLSTLLRRSTDEKSPEPPLPVVIRESHAYRCHWPEPECDARFTALTPRKVHHVQHWIEWNTGHHGTSVSMPGISSILA